MSTKPEALQTIDPTALAQVSGGTSTTDDALTTALGGILDSLNSISGAQSSQGMDPQTMMMMMMMMMNQRNQQEAASAQPWWTQQPQVYYW